MSEPERPALHAVPVAPEELPAPDGPPLYADITSPGERRPVLPQWLQKGNFRPAMARWRGRAWHEVKFHGLRSPWYLGCTLFWSVAGVFWLAWTWLGWWLMPVPVEAQAQAVTEGWRHWKTLHLEHKRTAKTRAIISAVVAAVAWLILAALWHRARLVLTALAAAGLLAAARWGRPEGVRIVGQAHVPAEFEKLTLDVVTRGLGSIGNAKIDRWLREGRQIDYVGPCRQDGPGWRAEANLPYGATAAEVIDRRAEFASGLRRPLGAVWPECITTEHPGRLEVWVGQQDVSKAKAPPWPLLRTGQADVFRPMPFAVDVRGRKVAAPLIYHNWLIGSIPRQGKTATVREIACYIALDPLAEIQVHELKGTGDLDPLEPLCTRFVSGIDDDSIAYTAESLRRLRAEVGRRAPRVKALPLAICPEKRVTREIARKYAALRPLGCVIDECQNLFAHPKHGKQAAEDAEFIIKVGPAMGIFLVLATQRPDAASLPKGISANVSIRFCLHVTGQIENDMVLGTSAYKNGLRATMFRPETDAGLGWLKGATAVPLVCRPHFLDVPAAKVVTARALVLRERTGTLPVQASAEPERDVLADVLAAIGAEPGVHWEVLAGRLADRWPDRWGGATKDAVSAQVQGFGVASVTVTVAGQRARGCRKDAIEAAMQ